MATEESNVVMNFKTDGAVEMATTVKELNTIMNTAAKQYRAQMAAMGDTATKTDELAARQQKLATQFEAAQKRTSMLTSEYDKMKASGSANSNELAKMAGKVMDASRYESNLQSALTKVNTELSANGQAALQAREKLANLATEGATLEAKQGELASAIKLENSAMGSNASASQKMATEEKQLAAQTNLAKSVVANLESQLKATVSAYGENSREASEMATKLNQAKTSVSELDNKMGSLGNQSTTSGSRLGSFKEKLSFGAVAGAASNAVSMVTGGLTGLIQSAAESSDSVDKFKSTMKGADFGSAEINKASKTMKTYADQTVYDTQTVMNTTAQLAANGVGNYTQLTQAAGNMNAQFGGTQDTFKSVAMVMTQTAGAGKLTTENWNQLADAIPGASGKLQEAMKNNGAYTGNFRDAMEKGQISSKEFNDAVTQLGMNKGAVEAAKSTSTFEGAIGSLQANVTNGMQKVLESIGKEKLTEIIGLISNGLVGALQVLSTGLKVISDHQTAFKALAVAVAGLFAAFKTVQAVTAVVGAFKSIGTAIKVAKSAFETFQILLMLNPFTAIIAGVAAVVVGLTLFFTQTKTGKAAWKGFIDWFKDVWNAIPGFFKGLWDGIKNVFNAAVNGIKAFLKSGFGQALLFITNPMLGTVLLVKNHWNEIKQATTNVFNAVKQFLQTTWNGIKQNFTTVLNGIKNVFKTIWDGIKLVITTVFGWIKQFFTNEINNWKLIFTTVWDAIKLVFTTVWDAIKLAVTTVINVLKALFTAEVNGWKTIFTTVWNAIKTVFTTVWDAIKTTVTTVVTAISTAISTAWNAIKEVSSSIFNGVKDVVSNVWNAIKSVVTTVASAVGSAVSSAWNAIKSGTSSAFNAVKDVVSNVWNGIKSVVSSVVNGVKSTVSGAWDAIKSATSNAFNGVKSTVSNIMNGIHDTISGIVSKIKSVFNGMGLKFPSISIPHIPLPHLSISGGFSIKPPRVPSFGINWYAKGGIFTQPTLLPTAGGYNGVGEAGPEAALPLNKQTLGQIGSAIASTMNGGQNIVLNIDGRTFAQIAGPYMSQYLKTKDATSNFSFGGRPF